MKRFIKALKRLWVIGTCAHRNTLETFTVNDGKGNYLQIKVCKICGRVIDSVQWKNESDAGTYDGVTV